MATSLGKQEKIQIDVLPVTLAHLDALIQLENDCFTSDQLSRRSFRRFISNKQSVFLVALLNDEVIGYLLTIFHRGTRLARLYSMAVSPAHRGFGVARTLMEKGEAAAQEKGALYYRLEVNTQNQSAIHLYHSLGFKEFKLIKQYYEDHSDALRMQKRIRIYHRPAVHTAIPWLQQSTPFTCGPATLMMALSALKHNYQTSLEEELEIWREATTIYMTSGHGGCHPLGLALAANARGLDAQVWVNNADPLFVDSVRSEEKKRIITTVHHHFVKQVHQKNMVIHYENITADKIKQACDEGAVIIILISTYQLDRKKAPHWVVVSGYDQGCFYLHDPDPDEHQQDQMDCQYVPIAHQDFERMSVFGATRMRTAIILRKLTTKH